MSRINPGFASTTTSHGGLSWLDRYIEEFFSGAWLPNWGVVKVTDWIVPQIDFGVIGATDEIDRRDKATNDEIPLGAENVFSDAAIAGIELHDVGTTEPQPNLPGETLVPLSDQEWFEMMYPGQTYVPATTTAPTGENDMPGDFFDDLGDVGLDWLRGELGLGTPTTQTPFINTGGVTPQAPTIGPAAGATPAATCSTGASPVYKKVCGVYKWVTPKRRRRRRLMTESDYNDLLRIEGLKVNKNMTVAIAKALTR